MILTPLTIFPEGTVTTGKHLLKFKKGAFASLLPLKPIMIKMETDDDYGISLGVLKFWFHLFYSFSFLYYNLIALEMPVISPTGYMFETYGHFGKTKADIYAEVVRNIYSEVGKLEMSNKTFDDMLDYLSIINRRRITNT